MTDLPPGWEMASFGDVAEIASNLVSPAEYQSLPHIAPNHIETETGRLLAYHSVAEDGVTSSKHLFRPGQILYSKIRPYLAKVTTVNFRGLCSADMYPINSWIDINFLKWWMLTPAFTESAVNYQGRSLLPKINAAALRKLPVPVPPLAEQRRIVATLEDHLSRLDAATLQLTENISRLERLRKRIIVDAVPTPGPPGWTMSRVADAGAVELGRQRHPDWHTGEHMRPYLRVANVFEDRIDSSDLMEMDFPPDVFERFRVKHGDILLNEGQSPEFLGRPAMYRGTPKDVAYTNSLLRFRPTEGVDPEWALLVFRRHMHAKRFIKEVRITTNIAHLSAGRFKSVEFPIPPLPEQRQIVSEVREQLDQVAKTSDSFRGMRTRSAALRRSLLAEAFAGRLVPQDPDDEPAPVLLERIRSERAATPKPKRTRRSTKQKDTLL